MAIKIVVQPHRSLSKWGFVCLLTSISATSCVAGLFFHRAGAWPITVALTLIPIFVLIAFYLSYRSGREFERIIINHATLTIEHVSARGELNEWRFNRCWARVQLEDCGMEGSQLSIGSHGKWVVVGRFLSPSRRKEVASELKAALASFAGP